MSLFKKNKELPIAKNPFVTAIIVAAGNATRMNGINKQFLFIDGVPVLIRTLKAFEECEYISEIVIATKSEDIPNVHSMIKDYQISKVSDIVTGGKTRAESVCAAIKRCSPFSEYFAIHDGARPLVTNKIISDVVLKAFETKAAATGTKVKDTIKVVDDNNIIVSTPNRNNLWAVATPQVFERTLYLSALDAVANSFEFTDDCKLIEEYGADVSMVEGSYQNLKITTPEDSLFAEAIIFSRGENID
ncbi:MAG: 2-C-methyl-D-erythritol 4-phosphate cytidylyltransferase [Oscillospiraceae bacterium]